MNKKERVVAAIHQKPVDFVPSGFSLHFPSKQAFGDKGVESHLTFFQATDTDIYKIMNENLVPSFGSITKPEDYRIIPSISIHDDFMTNQLTLTKKILDRLDGDAFTLGTLHGILASSIHPLEQSGMAYTDTREFLLSALRENPEPVLSAMHRIADGMSELALAYAKAGIDGIYYAALGAEKQYFTDDEFAQWIEPFDWQILSAIKEAKVYSFLHMCKENLNLERYVPVLDVVDVVNWGVYEAPYSLSEGKTLFKDKTIMGGLANRTGALVHGPESKIQSVVKEIIRQMGKTGFILGADCTLATEQNLALVRSAVQACRI
jgi:uroporphyrinogen decarboxylase